MPFEEFISELVGWDADAGRNSVSQEGNFCRNSERVVAAETYRCNPSFSIWLGLSLKSDVSAFQGRKKESEFLRRKILLVRYIFSRKKLF